MLSTDLSNRYTAPEKFYMGTKYIDQIQTETEELAKQVFGTKYADVRPLSGHSTDMILLTALTKPGDKIMIVGRSFGGTLESHRMAIRKSTDCKFANFPSTGNAST